MKLVNGKYSLIINMQENMADMLVLENEAVMAEFVEQLYFQSFGQEGDFVLSDNDELLEIHKTLEIIINPFALDFNNKKILKKLYSELSGIGNELLMEKNSLNSQICHLLETLISRASYNDISYQKDYEWVDLFKFYGIKIEPYCDTLSQKIIEYIKLTSQLQLNKILCFVNLKQYLNKSEIQNLYQMAFYSKIQLLLIESYEKEKLDNENVYIIDKDRCLIIK